MWLTRLVYSSNHSGTTEKALEDILATSQAHNEADAITGVLVASEEDFMQLLEGDRTAVAECMMRIMKDDRHRSIRILFASEVEDRLFSKWSMRLVEASQVEQRIRDRYWINGTFDPAQMPQAAIEELCVALADVP